jgi:Flp pilus assembly protein TadD
MSQRLKITSIVAVLLSLSGCLTWPDEASRSSSGPFASVPAAERGSTPPQQPEPQAEPSEPPASSAEGATGPLNSPVVVYRRQPRFEPVVVASAPSTSQNAPTRSEAPPNVVLQPGSGGQGNAAVKSLVFKADAAYDQGDYEGAIAQLERAVRIEPRNAHLWYKMASLRMALQEPAEAESLAQKSLGLAGSDTKLESNNWELIAVTRRMRGDTPGANFAARQATSALQKRQ